MDSIFKLSVFVFCLLSGVSSASEEFSPLRKLKLNPLFPTGRIVGGVDTHIRDLPHQVALEYRGSHFCGGTLISDSYVLTAAHCIIASASTIQVRMGTSERGNGGKVVPLSNIYSHPKYSDDTLDYDVAILQLAKKVDYTEFVKPAPIPDGEPAPNTYLQVSGWGMTKENGNCSPTLKSVLIPIIERERCQKMYKGYRVTITHRMICAYANGRDACQGDSGGPGMANGYISGVVSWGVGCARPNLPGVYTNVADPEIRQYIRTYAKV